MESNNVEIKSAQQGAEASAAGLMETLERAAQAGKEQNAASVDTGQNEPAKTDATEKEVKTEPKAEVKKEKAEPKADSKPKPKSYKESVAMRKGEDPAKAKEAEVIDWAAKYKELENEFKTVKESSAKTELTAEAKLAKKIAEAGGLDKLLGKFQSVSPVNKTTDQLLRDRTVRSLERLYGKDKITDDLIEEQLEKVKEKDVVTLDEMAESERAIQTAAFNKELEEFTPQGQNEVKNFANDLMAIHKDVLGKEISDLPVTEDRLKRMEARIETYSKSGMIPAADLYKAMFFLEHEDEILQNAWSMDRNEILEQEISKLQGKEHKVGNTRMTDVGASLSKEEEAYNSLQAKIGETTKLIEEKMASQKK